MKIFAFGDSFVLGDQDDFHLHSNYEQHIEYLKHNVSFVSIIARHLSAELENYAIRGCGNYPQLDRLTYMILNNQIQSTDIVFFGLTTGARDRAKILDTDRSKNIGMIDRDLITSADYKTVIEIDYFYVLSTLEKISQEFNIKIVAFNLFENAVNYSIRDPKKFNFDILVGPGLQGNTLIDILNDTWGKQIYYIDHVNLEVPMGYEQYYTANKHPSVLGHKKIAKWFLDNVDLTPKSYTN
jgi:hypothetical protein